MEAAVIGIDHLYLSVRSMPASERFYDDVLIAILGFRKNAFVLGDAPHIQYFNRHFGFVIRPADPSSGQIEPRSPGLHHLCLQVADTSDVDRVARALHAKGIEASAPRLYPEYAADYYATFFADPDGVRLEVTNFRAERKARMERWDEQVPAPPSTQRG